MLFRGKRYFIFRIFYKLCIPNQQRSFENDFRKDDKGKIFQVIEVLLIILFILSCINIFLKLTRELNLSTCFMETDLKIN